LNSSFHNATKASFKGFVRFKLVLKGSLISSVKPKGLGLGSYDINPDLTIWHPFGEIGTK
jgi:hypothetical protein